MKEYQENITNLHYSEKGGHLLRGRYWRAWEKLLSGNNFLPGSRALLAPVETTWQMKRFMPRYGVQDGKR